MLLVIDQQDSYLSMGYDGKYGADSGGGDGLERDRLACYLWR
jgi:hypothetical protein